MNKTPTYCLTCSGNTRANKEFLKARKWTYDPAARVWFKQLVAEHAARVRARDAEFLKSLGQFKGCRLCLQGIEVWRSKTYVEATAAPRANGNRRADPDGFGWNCDAFGNPVASKRIPGSAPDDCI